MSTASLLKTKTATKTELDPISAIGNEIENLSGQQAMILVAELMAAAAQDSIRLGGALLRVREEQGFKADGYKSFESFVEEKHGMKRHKAFHLIKIYQALINVIGNYSTLKWDDVKHLPWTKLRLIAPILTKENAKDWVAQAENMTFLQLKDAVSAAKYVDTCQHSDADPGPPSTKKTTTKTFKLHEDQLEIVQAAIDQVKEETGTHVDTVALERICIGILAGSEQAHVPQAHVEPQAQDDLGAHICAHAGTDPEAILMAAMKEFGDPEKILLAFGKLWPTWDIQVEIL